MSELPRGRKELKNSKVSHAGRPYSPGFENEQDRLDIIIRWIEFRDLYVLLSPYGPLTQYDFCYWEGQELRTFQNWVEKIERKGYIRRVKRGVYEILIRKI